MVPIIPEQPNLTKMKRSALLNLFLFALIISLGAVGCSRNPKSLTPIPGQGMGENAPIEDGSAFDDGGVSGQGLAPSASDRRTLENSDLDRDFFAADTVYFEFDSSAVSPNDIPKIQNVADHLLANPTEAVLIEGHCDERGTEEYNRALGERRALAVREILVLQMGANEDSVLTVSYGEDIPAVDGTTEEAYRLCRRGEFVLLRPKN